MTGLVRKATYFAVCGLMLAGAAMAGVPNAANSTVGTVSVAEFDVEFDINPAPNGIQSHQCAPPTIPCALVFTVINDATNAAVPFASVTVDFSTCASDIEMAEIQPDPDAFVNCTAKTITKSADANGQIMLGPYIARFVGNIPGFPDAPGNIPSRNIGPSTLVSCATVYAGGVLMGTAPVFINRFDAQADDDVDDGDGGYHDDGVGQYFGIPADYRTFYDYDADNDVDAGDRGLLGDAINLHLGLGKPYYTGPWCNTP
jgi:hypothetical protein